MSAPASTTIRGPFDVTLTPQAATNESAAIGRMSLDKTFHGDLAGLSGRMHIDIQPGGTHFYEFIYWLPADAPGR